VEVRDDRHAGGGTIGGVLGVVDILLEPLCSMAIRWVGCAVEQTAPHQKDGLFCDDAGGFPPESVGADEEDGETTRAAERMVEGALRRGQWR